jgi:monoterpene epsilon-lactone hydrolase
MNEPGELRKMTDPLISPVHGDFRGLPPTVLLSGTRDLFLSDTVRTHRKLRSSGVEAELHVFEGQSHVQFLTQYMVTQSGSPEAQEAYGEMAHFFNRRLGG